MPKGTSIASITRFFREGDLDTVRVTGQLIAEILEKRIDATQEPGVVKVKAKRHRRTKAEMEAAKALAAAV